MQIINAKIVTPEQVIEHGSISVDGTYISRVEKGTFTAKTNTNHIDAHGLTLVPGFIDLHVHGSAGADTMDATPEALQTMSSFFATRGVTRFLATTWTDTATNITAALKNIETFLDLQTQQHEKTGAQLLGAHLEGPYLNPTKGGAQNNKLIRRVDQTEATAFLDKGVIRLVSLAPEFSENHWLISECKKRGIPVSAAHTAASYEEMRKAVDLGLTQTTHTFNAMTPLHHREPGTVGSALSIDNLHCELICDFIHVHPVVVNILYRCKGLEKIILITDAMRAAGMPAGEYPLTPDVNVQVDETGVHLPDGNLAGSNLTMDRALRNFMQATGTPIELAWRAASLNAAQALGVDQEFGSIEVGKRADFVLLNEQHEVQATIVDGQLVYSNLRE